MKGDSDSRIIKYCTLRVPWVMVELREYCNSTMINVPVALQHSLL